MKPHLCFIGLLTTLISLNASATSITCPAQLICNAQGQCQPANQNGQPISAPQWQYSGLTGDGANGNIHLRLGEADLDNNQATCQYTYTLDPGNDNSILFNYHASSSIKLQPALGSAWQSSEFPGLFHCGHLGESTQWPVTQACSIELLPMHKNANVS